MEPIPDTNPTLSIGQIIKKAFGLYKRNGVVFLAISSVTLVGSIASLLFEGLNVPFFARYLLAPILGMLVSTWAIIALIYAISRAYHNESISLQTAFFCVRGHFWMYLCASYFVSLATMIGCAFLIIPGIYVTVVLALVSISAALDDLPFFDHMRMSRLLVRNHFWKVLFFSAISWGMGIGLAILTIIFSKEAAFQPYLHLTYFVTPLVLPVTMGFSVILYHALKELKQDQLQEFADAKRRKGSQIGMGILSLLGLGLCCTLVLSTITVGTSYFIKKTYGTRVCPLSAAPKKSVITYLTEEDHLTSPLVEAKTIEKEPFILYIPSGIDPAKEYPLMLVLSPNANPRPLLSAWEPAAEK